MEYITSKQFLEQSKEIQHVLIDWWQPSIGDLTTGRYNTVEIIQEPRDIEACKIYKGEKYALPLFTEGQLRKFIEEKTNGLIQISTRKKICGDLEYHLRVKLNDEYYWATDDVISIDLLQAYWQVVCQIVNESSN